MQYQTSSDQNPNTDSERHAQDVVAYYDETWLDYLVFWISPTDLAIHFGYFDDDHRTHSAALTRMNEVLADRVGISAHEHVLDAGCGVGGSAFWLAQHRNAKVTAITPVQSQIDRGEAQQALQPMGRNVRFRRASYAQCGLADASVDVVWAVESLCHAPNKAQVYQEFARVLRPGGRLVIAEYLRRARPLPPAGELLLHRWLDGWSIPDIDTEDEHYRALQEAGLVNAKIQDITGNVQPSLSWLHQISTIAEPGEWLLHRLGVRSKVQHGNLQGSIAQYQALQQGLWNYSVISAAKPA